MSTETKNEGRKETDVREAKPAHVIREGGVAAMIWPRQSATGFPYYEYSISRSWRLHSGRSGYSQNFFAKNHSQLIKVIEQASQWISANEPLLIQAKPLAA